MNQIGDKAATISFGRSASSGIFGFLARFGRQFWVGCESCLGGELERKSSAIVATLEGVTEQTVSEEDSAISPRGYCAGVDQAVDAVEGATAGRRFR